MKLFNILNLIHGETLTNLTEDIYYKEYSCAFACDLMSDCLAFVNDHCLLITGLTNFQSLRTAEMLDIDCVIYVRGKKPDPTMVSFAKENKITLISTNLTLYEASGLLYNAGLNSLKI